LPSLLDRLTDFTPAAREDRPLSRSQALRTLKASLWRDLSALLNAKRREEEVPEEFGECSHSLLMYGLPDFSAYSLKSPADQARLRRALEAASRRFEPPPSAVSGRVWRTLLRIRVIGASTKHCVSHQDHPRRLELDEDAFAAVLERFLGLYTAINSFTQLIAVTRQRKGALKRWPPRSGEQILL
jgi:type VI secretion system lysozyme-like protein